MPEWIQFLRPAVPFAAGYGDFLNQKTVHSLGGAEADEGPQVYPRA